MLIRVFWFIGLLSVASCLNEPDCYQLSNNYVGISFKKIFDNQPDTVSFFGISTPSSDSVFYKNINATSIVLELNPFESNTEFLMETIYGLQQVRFNYQYNIQFVSEDCGTRTLLSDFAVGGNTFDSVRIVNSNLTNPAQNNIEVYRCPRTNQIKLSFRREVDDVELPDTVQLVSVSSDYPDNFFIPGGKITFLNLPVNLESGSTSYIFEFSDGLIRELNLQYMRAPGLYPQCGILTLISKIESSSSTFSEVTIVRDSIFDPPLTNVAIYK